MPKINYWELEIPDKPKPEYTYAERRAYLLKEAVEKGHPDLLPKTELAEEFGISRVMIWKDLNALADYISENKGKKTDFIGEVLFKGGIKENIKDGNWSEARRLFDSWSDWLERRGVKEKEPDKHEHEHKGEVTTNINIDWEEHEGD